MDGLSLLRLTWRQADIQMYKTQAAQIICFILYSLCLQNPTCTLVYTCWDCAEFIAVHVFKDMIQMCNGKNLGIAQVLSYRYTPFNFLWSIAIEIECSYDLPQKEEDIIHHSLLILCCWKVPPSSLQKNALKLFFVKKHCRQAGKHSLFPPHVSTSPGHLFIYYGFI